MRRSTTRCVLGLAAAMSLAVIAAAPAQATVHERIRSVDHYTDAYDCGFPVAIAGTWSDLLIVREGKNDDAEAFPVLNRFAYRETHTNTETGEWFAREGHGLFNEVEATHVEGTVFEFRFVEAGQPVVISDSDGNLVSRNRGALHVTYLFDTLGDSAPGGEFVADVDFSVAGPHPALELEPCDIATELIG